MNTRQAALRSSSPGLPELALRLVGVATDAALSGLEAIERRHQLHAVDRHRRLWAWVREIARM